MILVDSRIGSGELAKPLAMFGVAAEATQLDFGDMMWEGWIGSGEVWGEKGKDGKGKWKGKERGKKGVVGVERKRIGDLCQSLRQGRLDGRQLEGMLETYDVPILLVEGMWRCGDNGELEVMMKWGKWVRSHAGMQWAEIAGYLESMEGRYGVRVVRTMDDKETVNWLARSYKWYQKPWEEHKYGSGLYVPYPERRKNSKKVGFNRQRVSLVVKMAAQITGLFEKAWEVGDMFKTPMEMVTANAKKWARVPGVGKVLSERIVSEMQGQAREWIGEDEKCPYCGKDTGN